MIPSQAKWRGTRPAPFKFILDITHCFKIVYVKVHPGGLFSFGCAKRTSACGNIFQFGGLLDGDPDGPLTAGAGGRSTTGTEQRCCSALRLTPGLDRIFRKLEHLFMIPS